MLRRLLWGRQFERALALDYISLPYFFDLPSPCIYEGTRVFGFSSILQEYARGRQKNAILSTTGETANERHDLNRTEQNTQPGRSENNTQN